MKRTCYLLLTLALVLTLGLVAVGCGGDDGATDTTAATTATTAAPTATTAAATDTTAATTATTAAQTATTAGEVITIKTATSNVQGSANADFIEHFISYVKEKSGGSIVIDCYYGGSFCSDPEVPDYVKKGDLGLSFVQCVYTMQSFPLGFSLAGYDSMQTTMDACWSVLQDPEVGPIIQAQAESNNWHLIGYTAAGRSLLLSKTPVTSWADAAAQKLTLGSPINLDIYKSYGLNTTAVEPTDMYEALSRGVCNIVAFSGSGIQTMKLTEVANNIGDMRSFFANQDIMFNLDLWNSFTPEQKAILEAAAKDTSDWSVTKCEELDAALKADITTKLGGTWNTFTDEEGKDMNLKSMKGTIAMLNSFADNLGTRAEQDKLTAAWAKVLNQAF